ncbi:ABC transporter substrate-binding protein [Desulfosporosinus shakirovi]|uniref:ABC transporter substrate-binding protein n=1 Tax=Desulfosporosinus shakirovi TaxID=2885154 RepID=UPI001E320117|nr:ABC transporter substrate-binding protein [Desulfosporosinus sp. SRJS8]MCB8814654.1 ABC transporter substrate-binding protein [Desulfosporosinus sp. SRJS8]
MIIIIEPIWVEEEIKIMMFANPSLAKLALHRLAALLLPLLLVLSGCSSPAQTPNTSAADPATKNELVLAVGKTDTGVFDPKKGWGTHAQIRLTHSSLLKIDSDLNFIGDLAKSYQISDDALIWTFPLREDVKFSNGNPVTAEDVKYTYEMLQEDGIKYDLSFVKSIAATDPHTIVIIWPRNWGSKSML